MEENFLLTETQLVTFSNPLPRGIHFAKFSGSNFTQVVRFMVY